MGKYVETDDIKAKLKKYISLTNGFDRAFAEAPAIDIVHCKDCVAYFDGECECDSLFAHMSGDLIGIRFYPDEEFYCGYGVSREEIR